MSIWWKKDEGVVERLANLAHITWSNWMKWVFELSTENDDGSITIPASSVERWKRQIATSYENLTEPEKNSDRLEAVRYLAEILNDHLHKRDKIGTIILHGDFIYYQTGEGKIKSVPIDQLNIPCLLEKYRPVVKAFENGYAIRFSNDCEDWEGKKLTETELKEIVQKYNEDYYLNTRTITKVTYNNYAAIQYADLHCEIFPIDNSKTDLNKIRFDKNYKLSKDELRQLIDNVIIFIGKK